MPAITRRGVLVGSAAMRGVAAIAGPAAAAGVVNRTAAPVRTRRRAVFGMPLPGAWCAPASTGHGPLGAPTSWATTRERLGSACSGTSGTPQPGAAPDSTGEPAAAAKPSTMDDPSV